MAIRPLQLLYSFIGILSSQKQSGEPHKAILRYKNTAIICYFSDLHFWVI